MNNKIQVANPLVVLHGDEMAQIAFERILEQFVGKRLDLELVEIDLTAENRLITNGQAVRDAIDAGVLVAPFSERVQTGFGYDLAVPVSTVNSPEIMAFVDWITAEAAASR